MGETAETGAGDRRVLATAFRRIRRIRHLRSAEVAIAMDVPLRSYQHLESGKGPFTVKHLRDFAEAADCDPLGLTLAGVLGDAGLAEVCADLKLATLAAMFVDDLRRVAGAGLANLSAATVLSALREAAEDLGRQANATPPRLDAASPPRPENVTPRQLECLSWVREGKSSADIGGILGLSPRTIDDHILKACRWFGVKTRGQAVEAALRLRMLQTYP